MLFCLPMQKVGDTIFGCVADFIHKSGVFLHILMVFLMGVPPHHLSRMFAQLLRPSLATNTWQISCSNTRLLTIIMSRYDSVTSQPRGVSLIPTHIFVRSLTIFHIINLTLPLLSLTYNNMHSPTLGPLICQVCSLQQCFIFHDIYIPSLVCPFKDFSIATYS